MIKNRFKNLGMTLPEVSLALMVMVIFMGFMALYSKYFQSFIKSSFKLDKDNNSWIQNENRILMAMDHWSNILSQPSYSRDEIKALKCTYGNDSNNPIWNIPGGKNIILPKGYKYCIKTTSFGESNIEDLISENNNARPGIYFFYALPDNITSSTKPMRKVMCRPIPFC